MAETNVFDIAEQQKAATAFLGSAMTSGAEPMLKAQADMLVTVQSTFTDWLHRRQEAVVDTQQLVARLRTNSDPGEVLRAQQAWMSSAIDRMAADASAYQAATQQLVDRARSWFPQAADNVEGVAAAARVAARPLRTANRAE